MSERMMTPREIVAAYRDGLIHDYDFDGYASAILDEANVHELLGVLDEERQRSFVSAFTKPDLGSERDRIHTALRAWIAEHPEQRDAAAPEF